MAIDFITSFHDYGFHPRRVLQPGAPFAPLPGERAARNTQTVVRNILCMALIVDLAPIRNVATVLALNVWLQVPSLPSLWRESRHGDLATGGPRSQREITFHINATRGTRQRA
jgi:hypothetical protein